MQSRVGYSQAVKFASAILAAPKPPHMPLRNFTTLANALTMTPIYIDARIAMMAMTQTNSVRVMPAIRFRIFVVGLARRVAAILTTVPDGVDGHSSTWRRRSSD